MAALQRCFHVSKKASESTHPNLMGFVSLFLQKKTMDVYRREVSGPSLASRGSSCMC